MVRRIIVPLNPATESSLEGGANQPPRGPARRRIRTGFWITIAPLVLVCGFQQTSVENARKLLDECKNAEFYREKILRWAASPDNSNMAFLFSIAACILVFYAVRFFVWVVTSMFSSGNAEHKKGVAVMLYPIGVQLTTVYFLNGDQGEAAEQIVQENACFIPRDQIIDSVVTEVVLAHKVRSVIVFRLRHSHRSDNPNQHAAIQLREAFPGVDLTYNECLAIRSQINNYIMTTEQ